MVGRQSLARSRRLKQSATYRLCGRRTRERPLGPDLGLALPCGMAVRSKTSPREDVPQRKRTTRIASQRAVARVLGVGVATVNRDLADVPNGTVDGAGSAGNGPPESASVPD